uniref:DNA-directed DNA polymerase family A palm domain-containing protein n=1 Tax=Caulobacter phage BL57 TaxID=3348355 RepID=A0AB74UH15_9VIRU
MGERLTKSEPPLQNIPIRTEAGARIRQAFAAEQAMANIDFAEIEARVLAELGPDYEITADGRIHDEFFFTAHKKDAAA